MLADHGQGAFTSEPIGEEFETVFRIQGGAGHEDWAHRGLTHSGGRHAEPPVIGQALL